MELAKVVDLEVTHEVSIYESSFLSKSKSDLDDHCTPPHSLSKTEIHNEIGHFFQIFLRRDGCRPLKETACLLIKLEQIVRQKNMQRSGLLSINLYLSSDSRLVASLSHRSCNNLDSMDIYQAKYIDTAECIKMLIEDAMIEHSIEEISRVIRKFQTFFIASM